MRYGTDCIRPKSPVYTRETERYVSNKKRYLTVWVYIVVSHAAVFTRRATLLLKKWLLTFELLGRSVAWRDKNGCEGDKFECYPFRS